MDKNEQEFFGLLSDYSRRNGCFVAEMFLDPAKERYIVCFRPEGIAADSHKRYVCRYIAVDVTEMQSSCSAHKLTFTLEEVVQTELTSLKRELSLP